MRPLPLSFRVVAPLALVTLIWGTTWWVITTQLGRAPAPWSVAYRFAIAAICMFAICLTRGRRLAFPRSAHLFFLALGVSQFVLNFNFVYQAERFVTSGLVAVAFALLIVPNAILARIFFGLRVEPRFAFGAGLGIAGVVLLFRQELAALEGTSDLVWGFGATVLAVLSASVANVMQAAKRARSYDMFGMLAWAMLYGALIDAAAAYALHGPPVVEWSAVYLGGLVYLAVFASALAFLLYFSIIREIGPAKAAYVGVVVPFVAMGLSTLLEGYRWTGPAMVGAGLTLLGLVIALGARGVPAGTAAAGGTTGRS